METKPNKAISRRQSQDMGAPIGTLKGNQALINTPICTQRKFKPH